MSGTINLRIIFALVISLPLVSAAQETYDVVINNGRVMDPETGLDAIRNVGIQDGKIAEISTDSLTGVRILEATGLVVAPGFINLNAHELSEEKLQLMIQDGIKQHCKQK